ncbi:MAG: D-serine ammonia-lyase [Christensenellaceae bacterium]|nr:D-serine ammonia-lyase [Christensenellaceae bacterium]
MQEIDSILQKVAAAEPCVWFSPNLRPAREALAAIPYTRANVRDAAERLARFAPYIERCFPETAADGGLIESPLTEIPHMAAFLRETESPCLPGRMFLKRDSDLAVAGSVKARGGIYEVLKHAETLALKEGILHITDDYAVLAEPQCKAFFNQYEIAVGSTGNLGLSIGIMSAALGFRVTVHMSRDARQWKKDLLRSKGVCVMEYAGDYSEAVRQGRALSDADPMSYFVDDENSVDLFMGYAVAAERLQGQLSAEGIPVDAEHPLFVYLPCGVGGAPGGITFGLKLVYGDNVHVFYVEPVQCPCMLLGLATGLNSKICVQDVGLTGKTHADGLAVGRPSGFVGSVVRALVSGEFTIEDYRLYDLMRALLNTEDIFIEPSACACLPGPTMLAAAPGMDAYLTAHGLSGRMDNAAHVLWATGGRLVPEEIRNEYIKTRLK